MHIKTILLIIMYLIISNKTITTPIKETNSEIIGNIIIEKIDLNMPLYNVKSPNNNIEKNIEILKESILPPNKNSIIFLAAHSGTSNISYFNNLNNLKLNDTIKITIKEKTYTYHIIEIYKQEKKGFININKTKEKQLILTTCDPTNDKYQLIINSIKKEFN